MTFDTRAVHTSGHHAMASDSELVSSDTKAPGGNTEHGLSADQVESLLLKLTTEEAFYSAFVKNPKAALESQRYPTELAACVDGASIATMEQLAAARKQVVESLTKSSKLTQSIFKLSTA